MTLDCHPAIVVMLAAVWALVRIHRQINCACDKAERDELHDMVDHEED